VEGNLSDLGHDSFGVQVILSDIDTVLYLVDEGSIIKSIDMAFHV